MSELKILIIEDEPVIAENISMYLNNADFTVSGIAYDDEEAMNQLRNNTPDAVILDINLDSAIDGIQIADHINKNYQLPFLFLTSYSDKETLQRAKVVEQEAALRQAQDEASALKSEVKQLRAAASASATADGQAATARAEELERSLRESQARACQPSHRRPNHPRAIDY
jgi:CheY-like chemotaxis protein